MRYPLDWNDLRYFLSVARSGTLSAAARDLRVNAGTVSRRISAMEASLGVRCFERRPDGYPLTEQGRCLLSHAERVEQEFFSLDRAVDAAGELAPGVVCITTTEALACCFVIPCVSFISRQHPQLRIELVAEDRLLDLSSREADLALRLGRPTEGDLVSRLIGELSFGLFASEGYLTHHGEPKTLDDVAAHQLIDDVDSQRQTSPAAWFRAITDHLSPALRVKGERLRMAAAELDMGITFLPVILGQRSRLKPVLPELQVPPMQVWLVTHPETARVRRVRTVMDFLIAYAAEHKAILRDGAR